MPCLRLFLAVRLITGVSPGESVTLRARRKFPANSRARVFTRCTRDRNAASFEFKSVRDGDLSSRRTRRRASEFSAVRVTCVATLEFELIASRTIPSVGAQSTSEGVRLNSNSPAVGAANGPRLRIIVAGDYACIIGERCRVRFGIEAGAYRHR